MGRPCPGPCRDSLSGHLGILWALCGLVGTAGPEMGSETGVVHSRWLPILFKKSQLNAALTGSSLPQLISGRNRFDTDSNSLSFHWSRWNHPSEWARHIIPTLLCHPQALPWPRCTYTGAGACWGFTPASSWLALPHFQAGVSVERSSPSNKTQTTPSAHPGTLVCTKYAHVHRHSRVQAHTYPPRHRS